MESWAVPIVSQSTSSGRNRWACWMALVAGLCGGQSVSHLFAAPITPAGLASPARGGGTPNSAAAPARPSTSPAPAVAASPLPFYNSADFTAEWIAPHQPGYGQIHRIAPFALRNQQGQTVTRDSLAGKIYVANFFFSSCPMVCPKMLANLRRIQTAFQDDAHVLLVSHSVMPDVDSTQVLQEYARDNGIVDGKWHLLTGDKGAIYDLARRSYFAEKQAGSPRGRGDFLHTESMLLIDGLGRIRGVYNATLPLDADRAIEDIRLLRQSP